MRRLLPCLLLIPPGAWASESYTITASSLYHPGDHSGGDVTIITKDEIKQSQDNFVQEVLNDSPSIQITNTGDNGRQTRFAMRGAIGGENLVLIDGIPVNDPAASRGTFDFADLLVDSIQQIEILPGSNSVIYGSDAMGGVVNIVTKAGRGKPSLSARAEGGSFRTGRGSMNVQGEKGRWSFSFTGAGLRSGKGSFQNKVHGNRQGDYYWNGLGAGRIQYVLTPDIELDGGLRWGESETRFDDVAMSMLPRKADNHQRARQYVGHIQGHGSFFRGVFEQILRLSTTETRRRFDMSSSDSETRGRLRKIHSRSDVNWSKAHITTTGAEYGWEQAKNTYTGSHHRDHHSVFGQHLYRPWKGGEVVAGTRYDHYESAGGRVTYRVAASQVCDKTRMRASYGTGFKAPLLSDQFNSSAYSLPNPNLKPENNHSADVGVDHKMFKDQAEVNVTFFLNIIEDVFANTRVGNRYMVINKDRRNARGIEAKLRVDLLKSLTLKSNLTYVHAKDKHLGRRKRSAHMPRLTVNGKAILKPSEEVRIFVSFHYASSQVDAVTRKKLRAYTTMTVGGEYDVTKDVEVYGRVDNLTDKRYEETYGYGVRGRAFYMGVRAKI